MGDKESKRTESLAMLLNIMCSRIAITKPLIMQGGPSLETKHPGRDVFTICRGGVVMDLRVRRSRSTADTK